MLGNELKLRRRQFSDTGVGHFYQGLDSMLSILPVPAEKAPE
jgi:hypothetical protein